MWSNLVITMRPDYIAYVILGSVVIAIRLIFEGIGTIRFIGMSMNLVQLLLVSR